jgi:hypothetical protein
MASLAARIARTLCRMCLIRRNAGITIALGQKTVLDLIPPGASLRPHQSISTLIRDQGV